MNRGFLTALTLAASTIMAVSGQAQDAKFTNLMGRIPASNEIVEALITPLGIRFEALGDDATTADTEQLAAEERRQGSAILLARLAGTSDPRRDARLADLALLCDPTLRDLLRLDVGA